MRGNLSLRGAHVRALLCVCSSLNLVSGVETDAFADDETSAAVLEAPPKRTFGEKGDVVFPIAEAGYAAGRFDFAIAGVSIDHESFVGLSGARQDDLSFRFAPGADVFVARHFSIGTSLIVGLVRVNTLPTDDHEMLTLGIAPRIGYAFPLTAHLAFWPHVGFAAQAADSLEGPPLTATPYGIDFTADAQLVYSIDRHIYVSLVPKFAIGGGPHVDHDPSSFEVGLSTAFAAGFTL